ncbi:hypothetical protein [Vibrio rhodolitus]|uniref:hypothetical protein n=1 Tax=Vibrio rhodolitus TaxID=2231649 RepID=UPI000E0BF718|nr:hypothetical protein [Vibrio rhodolitus]
MKSIFGYTWLLGVSVLMLPFMVLIWISAIWWLPISWLMDLLEAKMSPEAKKVCEYIWKAILIVFIIYMIINPPSSGYYNYRGR